MAGLFKLVAKDGDYGYNNGQYGSFDYVFETTDAVDIMRQFLEYVQSEDYEGGQKVTLSFKNKKEKDKKE